MKLLSTLNIALSFIDLEINEVGKLGWPKIYSAFGKFFS